MFSIEADGGAKRLIVISVANHVTADEVRQAAEEVRDLLLDVPSGFRLLTDFRWLQSMDAGAATHIAAIMDSMAEKGVASVVRVVPDPHKDIGLNILSQFHYDAATPITTVETLAEAIASLTEAAQESETQTIK